MSIQFTADNNICSIGTDNSALFIPRTFTFTVKIKLTSTTATGSLLYLLTRDYRAARLFWNGASWAVSAIYSSTATGTITSGASVSEWVSVALVVTQAPSGNGQVVGYVRRPGQSTASVTIDYTPETFSDQLGRRFLIGPSTSYYGDAGARFLAADAKLWSAVLSQSQIEAEWDQQAPVVSSGLMVANYFDGGNISAALTSDISNVSYGGTWTNTNTDGDPEANPTYSSDAPSYTPPIPTATLSGEDTLPQLESAGVAGDLTLTLGSTTISSAGTVPVRGALTRTLGSTTISAAGVLPIRGALTATLGNVSILASSQSLRTGNLSLTLAGASLVAAGSIIAGARTGALTQTLSGTSLSSVGVVNQDEVLSPLTATVVDNTYVATPLATDLSRTVRAVELQATVVQ